MITKVIAGSILCAMWSISAVGAYTTTVHLQVVSPYDIIIPEPDINPGSISVLTQDVCPDGDMSASYYDGSCVAGDIELMHASPGLPESLYGLERFWAREHMFLNYRDVVHILVGLLIRYHPGFTDIIQKNNLTVADEIFTMLVKIYDLPWKIQYYSDVTFVTKRDFVYFVILLRHLSHQPVTLNNTLRARIVQLQGYIRYQDALYLIQKYVLSL